MAAISNYLQNKIIDQLLRGQAYAFPATVYVGLTTTAETAAAGGTEVVGGGYARVAVAASLADWAGTQGAGTTVASTGTSGTTSNNAAITFPVPTAAWGQVVSLRVMDALTGGNLLFFGALTAPKTINNGDPAPDFPIGALDFSLA